MAMEPIFRTYCGVYPPSPDFKAFSLSDVGAKVKEEGKRFHVLLDVFLYFLLKTSKVVFEK